MTLRDRRYEPRAARHRAGFSMLEVMVAVVLMGIGLSGLCPLIIMQNRLAKRIELGIEKDELGARPNGSFQWSPSGATSWQDRRLRPTTPFEQNADKSKQENNTFFLVPRSVPWESKLAIGASLRLSGNVPRAPNPPPTNQASISKFTLLPDPFNPGVSFNVQVTSGS